MVRILRNRRVWHQMLDNEPTTVQSADLSDAAVAAIISERIRHGFYPPGCRVPPERVLDAELGVSRRLVRMAYDRLTAEGVIEKSHHRRPIVALPGKFVFRGPEMELPQTGLRTIAAILPSHPVCPCGLAIIAGIHRVLTDGDSPYRMSLYDTFNSRRSEVLRLEMKALNTIREMADPANGTAQRIDGLIWWCYSNDEVVAEFCREFPHISTVFIDRRPSGSRVDFVGIDDVESSRAAVEHLFEIGHRRVAHLMDPGNYSTIIDRAAGYREAHIRHGVPIDPALMVSLDWSEERMERALDH